MKQAVNDGGCNHLVGGDPCPGGGGCDTGGPGLGDCIGGGYGGNKQFDGIETVAEMALGGFRVLAGELNGTPHPRPHTVCHEVHGQHACAWMMPGPCVGDAANLVLPGMFFFGGAEVDGAVDAGRGAGRVAEDLGGASPTEIAQTLGRDGERQAGEYVTVPKPRVASLAKPGGVPTARWAYGLGLQRGQKRALPHRFRPTAVRTKVRSGSQRAV